MEKERAKVERERANLEKAIWEKDIITITATDLQEKVLERGSTNSMTIGTALGEMKDGQITARIIGTITARTTGTTTAGVLET